MVIQLNLPFPVSTNQYWRSAFGRNNKTGKLTPRTLLSAKAKAYKKTVSQLVMLNRANQLLTGRLSVQVRLFPPDRSKRDIDNFGTKSLLDSLTSAGVYLDDSQIDELNITRETISSGGFVNVTIKEI